MWQTCGCSAKIWDLLSCDTVMTCDFLLAKLCHKQLMLLNQILLHGGHQWEGLWTRNAREETEAQSWNMLKLKWWQEYRRAETKETNGTAGIHKRFRVGHVFLFWFIHVYSCLSGWCFGTFFIFPYIGNPHPNWLIFFRGVQTTNQLFWSPKKDLTGIRRTNAAMDLCWWSMCVMVTWRTDFDPRFVDVKTEEISAVLGIGNGFGSYCLNPLVSGIHSMRFYIWYSDVIKVLMAFAGQFGQLLEHLEAIYRTLRWGQKAIRCARAKSWPGMWKLSRSVQQYGLM